MTRQPSRKTENSKIRLVLFLAGDSPNSVAALENARQAIEEQGADLFHLETVDVFKNPDRALADQVLVTPTLINLEPGSTGRLVGNLSAHSRLAAFLRT